MSADTIAAFGFGFLTGVCSVMALLYLIATSGA